MRIVSLLPSATEIVYALGLGDHLLGVTHECDWPPEARAKQVVSRSTLPVAAGGSGAAASPGEIDRLVGESVEEGGQLYRLDHEAVRALEPDLVLTQDLCSVCAVPSGHVHEALELLGSPAEIVSLDPGSLEEVLDSVLRVGRITGTEGRAAELVDSLRERLAAVGAAVASRDRPRTFALEWSDPPFNAGHWVPGLIVLAGGDSVLGAPGTPSVRIAWDRIAAAAPDVVVFMPCGYDLPAAVREASCEGGLLERPELAGASAFYAVDASAYFSRPGPRLVDGVEILAAALHPGAATPPPPDSLARLR